MKQIMSARKSGKRLMWEVAYAWFRQHGSIPPNFHALGLSDIREALKRLHAVDELSHKPNGSVLRKHLRKKNGHMFGLSPHMNCRCSVRPIDPGVEASLRMVQKAVEEITWRKPRQEFGFLHDPDVVLKEFVLGPKIGPMVDRSLSDTQLMKFPRFGFDHAEPGGDRTVGWPSHWHGIPIANLPDINTPSMPLSPAERRAFGLEADDEAGS